jgi:ribosome-associated protein
MRRLTGDLFWRERAALSVPSKGAFNNPMDRVTIAAEGIRLGQLLKLVGIADTGGDAKSLLADGLVSVNGVTETRRGAQLRPGDVVRCGDAEIRLD